MRNEGVRSAGLGLARGLSAGMAGCFGAEGAVVRDKAAALHWRLRACPYLAPTLLRPALPRTPQQTEPLPHRALLERGQAQTEAGDEGAGGGAAQDAGRAAGAAWAAWAACTEGIGKPQAQNALWASVRSGGRQLGMVQAMGTAGVVGRSFVGRPAASGARCARPRALSYTLSPLLLLSPLCRPSMGSTASSTRRKSGSSPWVGAERLLVQRPWRQLPLVFVESPCCHKEGGTRLGLSKLAWERSPLRRLEGATARSLLECMAG